VWILGGRLLLRPYDDRGADLVGDAADLLPFGDRFLPWLLPEPPDRAVACTLAFACTVPWDGMARTTDPGVRVCARCDREVHTVTTTEAFVAAARRGGCVSIPHEAVDFRVLRDEMLRPRLAQGEDLPAVRLSGPAIRHHPIGFRHPGD
jgi:hypothetical protein